MRSCEDGPNAPIGKTFVRLVFKSNSPVDDPALQYMSTARRADRHDRLCFRDFLFDLHCASSSPIAEYREYTFRRSVRNALAFAADIRRKPNVYGSYRVGDYMHGHAYPRDGRQFRDDPKCEDDAATTKLDRRAPLSNCGFRG